jgi:hypothetical protein
MESREFTDLILSVLNSFSTIALVLFEKWFNLREQFEVREKQPILLDVSGNDNNSEVRTRRRVHENSFLMVMLMCVCVYLIEICGQ